MFVNPAVFYLPGATIPEVFKEADRQYIEEHKNDPKPVLKPIKVPMPFIHGCKGAHPKIIVTEDWYLKKKKKHLKEIARDLKETQIEMMELISQRDRIRHKLGELDPAKKKDAKRIVSLNIKLKDIEADLRLRQSQTGIDMNELDHGTRFSRFVGNVKRWIKKKVKKVKKFFKSNQDIMFGILSLIPAVITTIVKIVRP